MEIIIKPEPRVAIDRHIPFQLRSKMSQMILDAYKWTDILFNNTSIFKTQRGRCLLLPEAKNLAVEFFMIQAIKSGQLPFKYKTSFNSNHSHSYLELYDDISLIHFNQVKTRKMCGRKAFCRDRHIKPIHSYIKIDTDNIATIETDDRLYFQINHGYQSASPSFISLGIPNKKGVFDDSVQLLEEYAVVEGYYPKSKIENIDEFSFEEFQRFAEGEEVNDSKQTS